MACVPGNDFIATGEAVPLEFAGNLCSIVWAEQERKACSVGPQKNVLLGSMIILLRSGK